MQVMDEDDCAAHTVHYGPALLPHRTLYLFLALWLQRRCQATFNIADFSPLIRLAAVLQQPNLHLPHACIRHHRHHLLLALPGTSSLRLLKQGGLFGGTIAIMYKYSGVPNR